MIALPMTTHASVLAANFGDKSQSVLDDIRGTCCNPSLSWDDIAERLKDPSQYAFGDALPEVEPPAFDEPHHEGG